MNSNKNNQEINLISLIPTGWHIERKDNTFMKVSYENEGRGNNPKPLILPKSIKVDKQFIEAISMYLGDGKLSADLNHLEFTSIDKDMLYFMLAFFKNRFNLDTNRFTYKKDSFQINSKILRTLFEKIVNEVCDYKIYKNTILRRAFLRGLFAAEGGIGIVKKKKLYCLFSLPPFI